MNATSNGVHPIIGIERTSSSRVAVLTVICSFFSAVPVHGMTCIAPYPDLDAAMAAAEHVFVGRLVQARFTHRRTVVQGTFEALTVIKGSRDVQSVSFEAMVDRGMGCGMKVKLDARYVVFVTSPQGIVLIGPNTAPLDGDAPAERWVSRLLAKNEEQQ